MSLREIVTSQVDRQVEGTCPT